MVAIFFLYCNLVDILFRFRNIVFKVSVMSSIHAVEHCINPYLGKLVLGASLS